MRLSTFPALLGAIVVECASAQLVRYVDDNAPPGGDGTSWEQAINSLQTGLGLATSDLELRVGQGTYHPQPPNGNRAISFALGENVKIIGGWAGFGAPDPDARDIIQYKTILSGDLNDDDAGWNNMSENSIHVVVMGNASELDGVVVTKGFANDSNLPNGKNGAGLIAGGGATIRDCVIERNRCEGSGAGILLNANTTIIATTVRDNIAFADGGGVRAMSGGFTMRRCRIINNACAFNGGGLSVGQSGGLQVTDTLLAGNSSGAGGAIQIQTGSSASISNCTFYGNSAQGYSGISVTSSSMPFIVSNSIFWGGFGNPVLSSTGMIVLYCDVQGGYPGVENIAVDPLFVDAANDDFRLSAESPCIDAGDDAKVSPGQTDLVGCPRIQGKAVDMGALESGECAPSKGPLFGDLDGNGEVNGNDILVLLNLIGSCQGDVDFDGSVNVPDLLQVIGAWGKCP